MTPPALHALYGRCAGGAPATITETRYIRLADRDRYEREGWEVTPMASFHCQWSHIAVREVRVG